MCETKLPGFTHLNEKSMKKPKEVIPMKVRTGITFGEWEELYNHQHYLIPEHFHLPQKKLHTY